LRTLQCLWNPTHEKTKYFIIIFSFFMCRIPQTLECSQVESNQLPEQEVMVWIIFS